MALKRWPIPETFQESPNGIQKEFHHESIQDIWNAFQQPF
jgi:hypothetical protein